MKKEEFENNESPLGLIVSINIDSGKALWDTYDWRTVDSWLEDCKKDFPDMVHFMKLNKAAISERKKLFGIND